MSKSLSICGALLLSLTLACGGNGSSSGETQNPGSPQQVAPSITSQPQSQTVTAGQDAAFTVTATGTAPLSYHWKKDGNDAGTDASTLTLSNVQASDAGSYTVIVTNGAGSIISDPATLTVTATAVAPTITTQPVSQTVTAGENVTFTAVATGTAPLTYQWKKGTTNVGTNSSSFTINNVQTSNAGNYTVTITNGAGNVISSIATLTVNAADPPTGTTSYTPPAYLPEHSDGVPTTVQWIHCATLIVKDNAGGDLLGFFRGNNSLHAAVSTNDGASWSWVNPSSNVDIDPPLAIAQSGDGHIHIISWSWALGASYSRVVLTRDAGNHVIGFSTAAHGIAFPTNPDAADMSADIVAGSDQAGNPSIFYAIYENLSVGDGGRVIAGKTTVAAGLSPTATNQFVALDNAAGATQLDSMSGDAWASPHNACVLMAQHPVSKDLWFQWGPLNTGDGLTENTLPLKRRRATPSGPDTFALGATTTVATYANGSGTQNYVVTCTPSSVWFAYGKAACAVNIDKAAADGTITMNAVPSPYDGQNSGGFYTMAVNAAETDIWLAGQIAWDTGDPNVTQEETWAMHWNGSTWTDYRSAMPADERFRMARSAGWDNGLVFLQSRFDYDSWRPALGAIRTLP